MSWTAEMLGINMAKLRAEALPPSMHVTTEADEWLSLPAAGALTGYHPDSVRRYARQGLIASQRHTGRLMVSRLDCERLRKR